MNPECPWYEQDFEVVVIGGGPAGATAATYLAMQGHSVLLLERESGPRHRVGESLLPSMMPILEDFGLIEEVEALGFKRKTGGTFIWGKSREPWDVLFVGASIERISPSHNGTQATSWKTATQTFGPTENKGTPGKKNTASP